MAYTPTIVTGVRAWFEAKLKAGAIASVAAWTGTKTRTTKVTTTATTSEIGQALGALIDDLRTRGVIS